MSAKFVKDRLEITELNIKLCNHNINIGGFPYSDVVPDETLYGIGEMLSNYVHDIMLTHNIWINTEAYHAP